VRLHLHLHIQVTGRSAVFTGLAFTGQTDTIPGIYTGRDLHGQGLAFLYPALAMAAATRVGDDRAATLAMRTGLLHREKALLHAHLAMSAAGGTALRLAALFRAAAPAFLAGNLGRHADFYLGTGDGILQRQIQLVAQIGAPVDALASSATTPAAKDIAEHIAKNIVEPASTAAEPATTSTHGRINTGMTKLVIGRTLLRVGQNLVGLLAFLELLFGFLVIRITIRVMFLGSTPVGLFQFGLAGIARYTQHLVVISF
jgi:hypothetical protein